MDAAARSRPAAEEAARLRSLGYLSGGAPVRKAYGPEDDPKKLIELDRDIHRSIDLYQRGDLEGATEVARRLVDKRPTMTLAYENFAFLLRRAGRGSEALGVYRKAVQKGIAGEELRKNFALALSEAGRGAEALRVLAPLSASTNPDVSNALGIALADSGRVPDAIQAFEQALRLDPENAEAYENMGIVRLRTGDFPGARDRFRRALALDSGRPRAWNGLGVAHARLGNPSEAMSSWAKAIALDPTLYDALFNLGVTAAKNGARPQARRALERFIATAPASLYRADIEEARRLLVALQGGGG
jgi:superkiller protein 3